MSDSETRFAVLLFTDIVGSTELKARHGVPAFIEALLTHNGHFERLAHECRGIHILQNLGDGYYAEANSIVEALRFSLLFQDAMRDGPWNGLSLTTRVGLHAGEVVVLETERGSGIIAPAADIAARVMSIAVGGQILLTRSPFDEARHFIREHPPVAGKTMPPLRWLAHGPYRLKGRDEPMEVFEVGAEGLAPLAAPSDTEKAKRAIRPGEEETLGWRPAAGLEIPGRTGWQLTARLGAGGFGEVWVGEHAKLHQRRAFKFCFDDERLRALKREVTLVRLLRSALGERDDIVHIHELKLDAPPFYLESDLAPHGNLLQWAERQGGLDKIPLAQRIALVAHTATALAAAHSIGVLHKDIKPTNILIFDDPGGEPRPRLVDFGIGTLADPAVLGQHGVTAAGFTGPTIQHSTGTPTYSPPEYLAGRPYTIQGDIYGLGVLLYQLITVKPLDPLAPGWERDIADPLLREDIAACVDGDPARRLPSGTDLAERLLHLDQRRAEIAEKDRLAHEAAASIEAEAAATDARAHAARFRRLAAAFAFLALLAIAGGGLARMNQRIATAALGKVEEKSIEIERQKTEVEAKNAELDRKNAEQRAMLVESARSDRLVAEENLRAGKGREAFARLARACEYDPRSSLAAEMAAGALTAWRHPLPTMILGGHEHSVWDAQFSLAGTRFVTTTLENTAQVWDAATGRILATLVGHQGFVQSAQFSPDGTRIITASEDGTGRVWDTATSERLITFEGPENDVWSAKFSPDGTRIVAPWYNDTARVLDATTGKSLAVIKDYEQVEGSGQFSPDSTRIVAASSENTARVWDAATGKSLVTLVGHKSTVLSAEFSPDGKRIVTTSMDETARVWDVVTGKILTTLIDHQGFVQNAQFNSEGTRIIAVSGNTARIWDAVTGKSLITLVGHQDDVHSARFSPDGTCVVTASEDQTARVWDADTGESLAVLEGHEQGLRSAQFIPDGLRIVTASLDKTARVWDSEIGKPFAIIEDHPKGVMTTWTVSSVTTGKSVAVPARDHSGNLLTKVIRASNSTARLWDAATGKSVSSLDRNEPPVKSAQFSPDGSRIATVTWDDTAQVWDIAAGKIITVLDADKNRVWDAQFSPDGSRIAAVSRDSVRIWDAATGNSLAILTDRDEQVRSMRFSPNGSRIITAAWHKPARLWDTATSKSLAILVGYEGNVEQTQFSPDGSRIITQDENMRLWDVATGASLATLAGEEGSLESTQFSPDGTRIVTLSPDKAAQVWDAANGKRLATLAAEEGGLESTQFSPDGTRIVTLSPDKAAQVWDAATGKRLAALAEHDAHGTNAQFSPDGTRIVTASSDNTVRVWDAATGKNLATLVGHLDRVNWVQFSPDGSRVFTASEDNTARVWDPSTGKSLATLFGNTGLVERVRFCPDGARVVIESRDKPPPMPGDSKTFADEARVVIGSRDKTVRLWEILPPSAGPPPAWFADFLRYMAQMRLNSDGELETLKPDEWNGLRAAMRVVRHVSEGQDTPYLRILRRFVPE